MTPERFRMLAETYGADMRHWPHAEQAPAQAWIARQRSDAAAVLSEATELDGLLAAHVVAPASAALRQRIVAEASAQTRSHPRARWWWSGAGFAGIGLAGAVAGALLVATLHTVEILPTPAWSYPVTAFNDGADWSDDE